MKDHALNIKIPSTIEEAIHIYGPKKFMEYVNRVNIIDAQLGTRKLIMENRCPFGCHEGKRYSRLDKHLKTKHAG